MLRLLRRGYFTVKNNPNFKYVIIIRNPINNIASEYRRFGDKIVLTKRQKTLNYLRHRPTDVMFYKLIDSYKNTVDMFRKIQEDAITIVVRYEDLIHKTQNTLDEISKFLNMPLYKFRGKFDSVMTEYVGNKIDPKRANKFIDIFTNKQRKVIANNFEKIFQEYYPDINP